MSRTYPPLPNAIEHLREGIIRYVEDRVQTGGFLEAVLCNDLREAVGRADTTSFQYLKELVSWVYWNIPSACWGSPAKVRAWLDGRPS